MAAPLVLLDEPSASNQLADHAAFVLLAEFDIDQGSTLAHQYPYPTGTDEHALADLMLPDGAHLRAEDWTIFFLNQVPSNTVVDLLALDNTSDSGTEEDSKLRRSFSLTKSADAAKKGKGKEKQELLYVLNCVRMKEDKTLRRGARVKALAVCTPHPFIQIYKPLLVLALEEYFQSPSPSVLARLFDSLNAIDTSAMPRLSRSEKLILRASERRDLFEEKFVVSKAATQSGKGGEDVNARARAASVAFGKKLGLDEDDDEEHLALEGSTRTKRSSREAEDGGFFDDRVELSPSQPTTSTPHLGRSMSNASSSASSPPSSSHPPPPLPIPPLPPSPPPSHLQSSSSHLSLASSLHTTNTDHNSSSSPTPSRDSHSQFAHSNVSIAIPLSTPFQQQAPYQPQTPGLGHGPPPPGKGKKLSKDTHFFETGAWFRGISVPIRIPLGTFEEEVGDYSLIHLIQTFSPTNSPPPPFSPPYIPSLHTAGPSTNPIILLFNALVTQRRVIFLGHGKAAGQVANFVLAACALGSGGGGLLKGFTARAFPYANLAGLDMLEEVPGYIAGVTNPRFEDLPSRWDVLCNIETGRITLSKEIKLDPSLPPSSASPPISSPSNNANSFQPFSPTLSPGHPPPSGSNFSPTPASSYDPGGGATPATLAQGHGSSRFSPSLVDGSDNASIMTGTTAVTEASSSRVNGPEDEEELITKGIARQSRSDSKAGSGQGGDSDAAFMEEIHSLISSHFGEAIIRTRFADYLHRFIRLASRYEEETNGVPAPTAMRTWFPALPCDPKRGRLGSGAVLWDGELWLGGEGVPESRRRESDLGGAGGGGLAGERRTVKEYVGATGVRRIEGWRSSKSYDLWREDFNHSPSHRSTLSFDLTHQLSRLRFVSTRSIFRTELKMLFKSLATEVRSYDSVIEVLAHLPSSWGGLLPLGFALFHDSNSIKGYVLEFFDSLQQYPIGRSFLHSLNAFHRLAYRRLSDQRLVGLAWERDEMVRAALTEQRRRHQGVGTGEREGGAGEGEGEKGVTGLGVEVGEEVL